MLKYLAKVERSLTAGGRETGFVTDSGQFTLRVSDAAKFGTIAQADSAGRKWELAWNPASPDEGRREFIQHVAATRTPVGWMVV